MENLDHTLRDADVGLLNYFDQLRTGVTGVLVTHCYCWWSFEAPPLHLQSLPAQGLVVCDNYWSLADRVSRLYELSCIFRKPLVLHEQLATYEELFPHEEHLYSQLVRAGGFDSVVYTPHPYGRGVRQARLLDPLEQVVGLRVITDYDTDEVLARRQADHPHWRTLMRERVCPYTKQQLHELELRLMAYRYAYYIEANPIVTDRAYDMLDGAVLPWLPADSPLQQVGSDLSSSYRPEHIAYAQRLRKGVPDLFQP